MKTIVRQVHIQSNTCPDQILIFYLQDEIKHIMKKRTTFETNLIRRIPKKVDFMRYVAYEMGLEALRSKRVKRLSA